MSLPFGQKEALHRYPSEQREVDNTRVFDAVAETSAGRDERVGECEGSDFDGQI
jgi:hypothetical protein